MASRIIEAKAVISAEDRTGAALDAVARKLKGIEKSAGSSAGIDRMAAALERVEKQAKAIDGFRASMSGFTAARTKYREVSAEVEKLARDLDQARRKAAEFDGVKAFSKKGSIAAEMQEARKAVTDLERALTSKVKAVRSASNAFDEQRRSLAAARSELRTLGVDASRIVSEQGRIAAAVDRTAAALKREAEAAKQAGEAAKQAAARHRDIAARQAERVASRREAIGTLGAGAGVIAAHKGKEIGKKAVVSAAEFDIAVRKQREFMGLTVAQQDAMLIPQAKRIGQETQFSNIDVVKAQTKAMQGMPSGFSPQLKAEVAQGILENVKNYALVMEADLEKSAEAVRDYLQQTGKDISTKERALAEANKATNQLVKMAKVGGMNDEDVQQFMKFAASSGTTAGLSSETLMSLAALARRGGLRGDEAGTFIRTASGKLVAPTKKGRMALNAAGINFDDYVRMPGKLETSRLEAQFRADLGTSFNPSVRKKLDAVLANPNLIKDQGKFTEAVTQTVSEQFPKSKKGGISAMDRQRIAKTAKGFHQVSAETVDTERLLDDAMKKNMSLLQLNAWLTDKHGGKGAITQRQWDEFRASRQEIAKTGDDPNFAKRMADEIMAGLGGSFERLKGSVDNLILSLGEANQGVLKLSFDKIGDGLDAFANMSKEARQAASVLGLIGAAGLGTLGAIRLVGGILGIGGPAAALTGSAVALDASAAALTAAAVKLGGGSLAGAGASAAGGAGAAATGGWMSQLVAKYPWMGAAGRMLRVGGAAATPILVLRDIGEAVNPMTPEGYPYRLDQKITAEQWEKARRAQVAMRMDPEGERGRAWMRFPSPSQVPPSTAAAGPVEVTGAATVTTESRTTLDIKFNTDLFSAFLNPLIDRRVAQVQLSSGKSTSMPEYETPRRSVSLPPSVKSSQ